MQQEARGTRGTKQLELELTIEIINLTKTVKIKPNSYLKGPFLSKMEQMVKI